MNNEQIKNSKNCGNEDDVREEKKIEEQKRLEGEKSIDQFVELIGSLKDVNNFQDLLSSMKKKKDMKNRTDLLISFLNNLQYFKIKFLKDKKIKLSLFGLIFKEKGEEEFFKGLMLFLEEQSKNDTFACAIYKSISEFKFDSKNLNTSFIQNNNSENRFISKFKHVKTYDGLIKEIMNSSNNADNTILYLIEFLSQIEEFSKKNKEDLKETVFREINSENCGAFKENLFLSLQNSIESRNYNKKFIELIDNFIQKQGANKQMKDFSIFFDKMKIHKRLKIDLCLEEFNIYDQIKTLVSSFFTSQNAKKINIFVDFLLEHEFFTSNYRKEIFINTAYENLFNNKHLFFHL